MQVYYDRDAELGPKEKGLRCLATAAKAMRMQIICATRELTSSWA